MTYSTVTPGEAGLNEDRVVNMLASLEMIKSKYGGADGYLKQKCGFTDHDIQKIRANVTESRFTNSLDES